MALFNQFELLLREHEFELTAPFTILECIDEKVKVVHLFHLLDKLVDLSKEVLRVHIVDEVDIEFMLS